MGIGEKIQKQRKGHGMSQEKLAEELGISRQSVSKWEAGQSVPDPDRIVQMSDLFGVTTDHLLKDEGDGLEGNTGIPKSDGPVKRKWVVLVAGILLVSLIANLVLRADLRTLEKNVASARENNQTAFFETLEAYNDVLKDISDDAGEVEEGEKEVERLKDHADALVHYATSHAYLSRTPFGGYLLDVASSARWILLEYFLEADEQEISGDSSGMDTGRMHQVAAVLDAMIALEAEGREEMRESGRIYREDAMVRLLEPLLLELVELTILHE